MRHSTAAQVMCKPLHQLRLRNMRPAVFGLGLHQPIAACTGSILIVAGREGQTDHRNPHSFGWFVFIFGIAILEAPPSYLSVKRDTWIIAERGGLFFCGGTGRCSRKRRRGCSRHQLWNIATGSERTRVCTALRHVTQNGVPEGAEDQLGRTAPYALPIYTRREYASHF